MKLKVIIKIVFGATLISLSGVFFKFSSDKNIFLTKDTHFGSKEIERRISSIKDPLTKMLATQIVAEFTKNALPIEVKKLRLRDLSKEKINGEELAKIFNKSEKQDLLITTMDESPGIRLIEIKIESNNDLKSELNLRLKR